MSDYMPSLDDIHEPEPVPDGFYEIEIVEAKRGENEKAEWINVTLSVLNSPEGNPRPPFIFNKLWLPGKGAEDWKVQNSLLALKRFVVLFGITPQDHPLTKDEIEDWVITWRRQRTKCKLNKIHNDFTDQDENVLVVPRIAKSGGSITPKTGGLRTV